MSMEYGDVHEIYSCKQSPLPRGDSNGLGTALLRPQRALKFGFEACNKCFRAAGPLSACLAP